MSDERVDKVIRLRNAGYWADAIEAERDLYRELLQDCLYGGRGPGLLIALQTARDIVEALN